MYWTSPGKRALAFLFAQAALLALLALPLGAAAPARRTGAPAGNYDARLMGPRALAKVLAASSTVPQKSAPTRAQLAAQVQTMQRALDRLRKTAPGAIARLSQITAAPEMVSGEKGPLSAAAPGRPGIDAVRDFLRANRDLYGLTREEIDVLHFLGESVSPSGLRMVRVEQRRNGLPVFQSETRFILDRQGRIWRSLGLLVPSGATVPPVTLTKISARDALASALKSVGIREDQVASGGQSDMVYVPVAPGRLVPAWRQITFTEDGDWYMLVDAATGTLLWRKDLREHVSTQQARFNVYVQADGVTPADSPAPHSPTDIPPGSSMQFPEIARTTVSMLTTQDITASPDGWIPDGGTTTTGNNVDACVDRIVTPVATERNVCDIGTIDFNGRPVGNPDGNGNNRDFLGAAPRDFTYSPAPVGGDPNAGDDPTGTGTTQINFRRGSVTQIFYIANWYHDRLFKMGFDEAAGNFQNTNFSGMGLGNDRLRVDVQDGQGQNVPFFTTAPDGMVSRLTMHRFVEPTPNRDSALDGEIAIHELTHGLTNRLIGNAGGLAWSVGRSMGEGWSDFYALSLLNGTNADDPNAEYAFGAYSNYQRNHFTGNYLYGPRRFPYSTDNTINPLTWADVDDTTANVSGGIPPSPLGGSINGALDVFNAGEVWGVSLWEVRSRIIADPAGANGDVPTGNETMLQLVTDALKMTPASPSFTDARDALILADCATNACANERWIWEGFADRGLGYGAVAPVGHAGFTGIGHIGVGESFSIPHLDVAAPTVDDSLGNNNGSIDPGEPIRLTVPLTNPWHNTAFGVPGATAILTSSTPGVTIFDGASTYGAIAAQGTTPGDTFLFTVSPSALCGQSLKFTLTSVSALGTSAVDFTVRVGAASGTGAPVTYTRTLSPGLAIPDGDRRGITDTLTVTDDLEIADLDFRVDNLQHNVTGDLTLLLKAPNGYGTDLIWQRGAGVLGDGSGANFVNTVIDDESTNDLNQTVDTDAPYTGSWAPAFNSDVWLLFPASSGISPDPVGQLSRVDGLSTQGNWKVLAADVLGPETGTLNAWSLIVTPTAFQCLAFAPAATLTATKTVSGTFNAGGTVTYTVTLTNNGTGAQPDNAGNEFTDVLPAGLTLVSANATSGTAVATVATNTVTWNGSLAPAGGTVTITITATVKAGTQGQTISNQGSAAFDADLNGTNEATAPTDDPGTAAAGDATSFAVAAGAFVTGTKAFSGSPAEGATITYTVVLTNSGAAAQGDNAGNEFTDVLPATLTLLSASATSGTAVANTGTNTVTWNGAIPASGSVTITIQARINNGTSGQTVSNQGSISFDGNGDGTNDTTGATDDPASPAAGDATAFAVGLPVAVIPTLSEIGFAALAVLLAGAALVLMRRRRTV